MPLTDLLAAAARASPSSPSCWSFPRGIVGGVRCEPARAARRATPRPRAREGRGMSLLERRAAATNRSAAWWPRRDVTFAVEAGRLLAIIGPNGAGKSTIFNMVGGQLAPDRGRVLLAGAGHHRPAAAAHLAPGRRPHLPGGADVRVHDGGRERADGAASAATAARAPGGPTRPASTARRRWRCSIASAWRPTPTGPAASWPTATSSASSSPSRWPARRSCC